MRKEELTKEQEYRELLNRIPGIYSSSVVCGESGELVEIHVLAGTGKALKALTRDIQSALMAAFALTVDYRIISIASVEPQLIDTQARLRFAGVESSLEDGEGEIVVRLSKGDHVYAGKAHYSKHLASKRRGIVKAALSAVADYATFFSAHEVLFAEMIPVGMNELAVVGLSDRESKQLLGSSYVEENDIETAFIKATLSALNRQIAYQQEV